MYHLSTSCLILFFLFSLFHPLTCDSSIQEFGVCETLFQCGNITAGFPFCGGNRAKHCGHPLLELHCFDNITSLSISDHVYHVLHIDHTSSTLRLGITDYLESFCSSTFTNATLPQEIFDLSPTYKSITFYHCNDVHPDLSSYRCPRTGPILVSGNPEYYQESCHASFTMNVPTSFVTKEKKVNITNLESILEKGFEVKMKIDMKGCQDCSSSYGFCGFNKTFPFEVKCIPLEPLIGSTEACIRVKILRSYYRYDDRLGYAQLWLILADERGARINAKVDTVILEDFDEIISEGKWKIVKKFGVSLDDAYWRPILRAYKITISETTEIYDSPQISRNLFATFVPFQRVVDGTIDADVLIELVGKVSRVGEIVNFAMDPDDVDGFRLHIYLTNRIGQVIQCLLTGFTALEFVDDHADAGGGDVICVLRWWKVYQAGRCRFGVHDEGSVSQYLINPNIPEVQEFQMD